MQTYRNEFFIKRDFGFYDSGILGCLPNVTFDIYEVIRRWIWRSLETGDPDSRRLYAQNQLATTMSQSEIADALGRDRKTVNGHIAGMKELGWLKVTQASDGTSPATYVLGERIKDGQGRYHEVFYADSWMKGLWDVLEGVAHEEMGERGKVQRLSWDRRREVCREYLARNSEVGGGGTEDSDDDSEDDPGSYTPTPGEKLDTPVGDFLDRGCPENLPGVVGGLSRKTDTEIEKSSFQEDSEKNMKGSTGSAASSRGRSHWDRDSRSGPMTPGSAKVDRKKENPPTTATKIRVVADTSEGLPEAQRPERVKAIAEGMAAPRLDPRAESWKQKTERERERQVEKERGRERTLRNFDGTKPYAVRKAVQHLERIWRTEAKELFGTAAGEWQAKERVLVESLLKSYNEPLLLEEALRYVIRQWVPLNERLVPKKKPGTVPTITFLSHFHATVVPEAREYAMLYGVKDEWTQWFKENPNNPPPAELRQRYRAVKSKLEAMGLA
jgi:hypothetical protein